MHTNSQEDTSLDSTQPRHGTIHHVCQHLRRYPSIVTTNSYVQPVFHLYNALDVSPENCPIALTETTDALKSNVRAPIIKKHPWAWAGTDILLISWFSEERTNSRNNLWYNVAIYCGINVDTLQITTTLLQARCCSVEQSRSRRWPFHPTVGRFQWFMERLTWTQTGYLECVLRFLVLSFIGRQKVNCLRLYMLKSSL